MAGRFTRWYAKLKHWHAVWHVGTYIGTLARWNVKMRSWHAFGTLSCKPRRHASILARRPRWHADTQTRSNSYCSLTETHVLIATVSSNAHT